MLSGLGSVPMESVAACRVQSVLKADKEREWLLKQEAMLCDETREEQPGDMDLNEVRFPLLQRECAALCSSHCELLQARTVSGPASYCAEPYLLVS